MTKIMIIDDDPEQRAHLSRVIEASGFSVVTYDCIKGAVEMLASEQPDLLLLDVMFPENPSGGFELAMDIRRQDRIRNIPVILLTNINQEFPIGITPDDIDPRWMPVQDVIEKPADAQVLLDKIAKLLKTP